MAILPAGKCQANLTNEKYGRPRHMSSKLD
jgi:hypothetical protein